MTRRPPGQLGRLATRLERRGTAARVLGGLLWRAEHVAQDPGELAIMARRLRVVWRLGGLSEVLKILGRRRFGARVDQRDYALWVARYDVMSPRGRRRLLRRLRHGNPPSIGVLLDARQASPAQLAAALADLRAQLHGDWQALVRGGGPLPDDEPRLRPWHEAALPQGDWLCWLDARDRLPPWAFAAVALGATGEARLIYADHDRLDAAGQRAVPAFKPDWNATLLRGGDYLGPAVWLRRDLVSGDPQAGLAARHGCWLAATAGLPAAAIRHLPQVLLHLAADAGPRGGLLAEDPLWGATGALPPDLLASPALPDPPPLVSVIVPTRDRLALLEPCIRTLLAVTAYPALELLVVDNGSVEPATLAYLEGLARDPRVRVLRDPGAFNFAALNNRAAEAARGELLCLLNNDIEVTAPGWLNAMAGWACQADVGAVGARLLYPDGTLQHAGVTLGLGEAAGHLYRGLPSEPARAPRRSLLTQELSAVTAACLVLRRADYLAVGGMNAADFAVAYNDVDLCLKLAARGLKILYTPAATLLHRESQSRGQPDTAAKIERQFREIRALRRRWLARLQADPQYNPNLSIYDDQSSLAWPPRLSRPWL